MNQKFKKRKWLIWNFERNMYWKQNRSGYTSDKKIAGLYEFSEAIKIVIDGNIVMDNKPQEAMIPLTN